MRKYDVIVIGFGKAGKTLAAKLANQGKKVALIEENTKMFGGTCINIGCIPTKTLIHAAEKGLSFDEAMQAKDAVVGRLNAKNAKMLEAVADIYVAHAQFVENKVIALQKGEEVEYLSAEIIIINTGAHSHVLPIEGLATAQHVYDSTGIQQLSELPKRLGVIGGGNIGLEFANLYATLGAQVSVFEAGSTILGRYEPTARMLAKEYLEQAGITFHLGASITRVENVNQEVVIHANGQTYTCDAMLYATGRKPNTQQLGLENTTIELTDRGAIKVDEHCQTTVKNVFAVGDVNGGLQFTYVSLDDFRIVFQYLNGNGSYTLSQRKHVPTTLFIQPPLSTVGITEEQAKAQNLPYATKELFVANMPKAHVNGDLKGVFKVIVDTQTKAILGATLLGDSAHELINLITMAMDNHIPYTYLATQIFTHPTMAENLNDLFSF